MSKTMYDDTDRRTGTDPNFEYSATRWQTGIKSKTVLASAGLLLLNLIDPAHWSARWLLPQLHLPSIRLALQQATTLDMRACLHRVRLKKELPFLRRSLRTSSNSVSSLSHRVQPEQDRTWTFALCDSPKSWCVFLGYSHVGWTNTLLTLICDSVARSASTDPA